MILSKFNSRVKLNVEKKQSSTEEVEEQIFQNPEIWRTNFGIRLKQDAEGELEMELDSQVFRDHLKEIIKNKKNERRKIKKKGKEEVARTRRRVSRLHAKAERRSRFVPEEFRADLLPLVTPEMMSSEESDDEGVLWVKKLPWRDATLTAALSVCDERYLSQQSKFAKILMRKRRIKEDQSNRPPPKDPKFRACIVADYLGEDDKSTDEDEGQNHEEV